MVSEEDKKLEKEKGRKEKSEKEEKEKGRKENRRKALFGRGRKERGEGKEKSEKEEKGRDRKERKEEKEKSEKEEKGKSEKEEKGKGRKEKSEKEEKEKGRKEKGRGRKERGGDGGGRRQQEDITIMQVRRSGTANLDRIKKNMETCRGNVKDLKEKLKLEIRKREEAELFVKIKIQENRDGKEALLKKWRMELLRREEAEGDVAAVKKRIKLLEHELERSNDKLSTCATKFADASNSAQASGRIRKILENRNNLGEERIQILEQQLNQARHMAEDADKRYTMALTKLSELDSELSKARQKDGIRRMQVADLEDNLIQVQKALELIEISEEKSFKIQLSRLVERQNISRQRAEYEEKAIQQLQREVERLID